MTDKQAKNLIEKYFTGPCPLDEDDALLFLSAYDNLLYLEKKYNKRLEELRRLVVDNGVSDSLKSNYRYEAVHLVSRIEIINNALANAKKYISYSEDTYHEFMEVYSKLLKKQ